MKEKNFIPLKDFPNFDEDEMLERSKFFKEYLRKRRSIREFSSKKIPIDVIKNCLLAAGTAPSGANMQPWHFVVITNSLIKRKIRIEAEKEEREFYENRAPDEWLEALTPFGTDSSKPFLENAPVLIAVFEKKYHLDLKGNKVKHYYIKESVGISVGMLITSLHYSGLATLTHTPSPMNFLNGILGRPRNEKPFLILVVGYPAENVKVPDIKKKELEVISTFV
ncbi:dihydropteridine reductase [bacterium BMS3Abin04]|nr:dihydropteridine reductase [bacterium BMS3Abin04]